MTSTGGARSDRPVTGRVPSPGVIAGQPADTTTTSTAGAVDVVVVAFGASELLEVCLSALEDTLPLVVVDNSSDPSVRSVAGRHGARYIDPGRNLGFAGGVNLGLEHGHVTGRDVLLLNPDAQIAPADVARLHQCLLARPDLACVAPAQVDEAGGQPARVGWPFPTPAGAWIEAFGLGRLRRHVDFVIGSVLMMSSAAIDAVGPFDERFFLYAEETDWQRRARDLGWDVAVCPEAAAVHVGAGTGGDSSLREIHFHASHERFVRKYHGAAGWQVYRAGALVGACFRAIVLPRERARKAAYRFHLYRQGPGPVETRS
jgi:GT2 family glycosyltransferase